MISNLFSKLRYGGLSSQLSGLAASREEAMRETLGDPEFIDRDTDRNRRVDVYGFGRNFVAGCDGGADDDAGVVLVTSGMSDRLMPIPPGAEGEASPAAELIWYVREPNREFIGNLRWLAKLAAIDRTWFGSGHRVPMPDPPLSFCGFRTFLLLTPIVRTDRELLAAVRTAGHPIETLCVHLISEPEYALIKRADGLRSFFDLLDEGDYPIVFDPRRESLL
jgi:hypothetical protein